ncbi:MAG: hypothetical protein KDD31_06830, partial [Muricauda sp.]|nr:hypothetical protein [Allomuricauda sp.]
MAWVQNGLLFLYFTLSTLYAEPSNTNIFKETDPNHESFINEAFVPTISLIKSGITYNALGEVGGCDSILYTFEVSNQSTNGEIFENVVLTDPMLGGIIVGPTSGDDNNNTFLDPGEIWVYQLGYGIT